MRLGREVLGNNIKTNNVSFALIANIDTNVSIIVKGSRTIVSNDVKNETSTNRKCLKILYIYKILRLASLRLLILVHVPTPHKASRCCF